MLEETIERVLGLSDLRPSLNTNRVMTQLVHAVVQENAQLSIHPSIIKRVQTVASQSESEMEVHWAHKIIKADDPHAALAVFPYCANYRELVRREIHLIERSGLRLTSRTSVLVIGSGPLPMTALELMHQRGVSVDHVDSSPRAIKLCAEVGHRLGATCGHFHGYGESVRLSNTYDVIIIAGLAGQTIDHKQAILDNVLPSLRRNGRLLVRSARGARELLYPALPSHALHGVTLLDEYHPHDEVINSVFIYGRD